MDIEIEIELEMRMREALTTLQAELEAGKESAAPPESLDGTIGRLSRQDSLMQQEIAKDAQRRRNQRVYLLREALDRIDQGTYGECVNCGQEINEARLQEVPEAQFCIACS